MALPPKVEYNTNIKHKISRSRVVHMYPGLSSFNSIKLLPCMCSWNYFPASHSSTLWLIMIFPNIFAIIAPQAEVTLKSLLWAFPLQSIYSKSPPKGVLSKIFPPTDKHLRYCFIYMENLSCLFEMLLHQYEESHSVFRDTALVSSKSLRFN